MPGFSRRSDIILTNLRTTCGAHIQPSDTSRALRSSDDPSTFNSLQECKRLVGTDLSDRVSPPPPSPPRLKQMKEDTAGE